MRLSNDQKNILKGCVGGWAGMVVALIISASIGKLTWSDALWIILGLMIVEIIVGAFLMLGAKAPKSGKENHDVDIND